MDWKRLFNADSEQRLSTLPEYPGTTLRLTSVQTFADGGGNAGGVGPDGTNPLKQQAFSL